MSRPEERDHIQEAYADYAASPAKRRSWSSENPGNRAIRIELARSALAAGGPLLTSAQPVLDVGCGTGWWLEHLASSLEDPGALHGVDILPERVEAARQRVPGATIAVADARELPYPGGRFAVVSLFTVLSSMSGAGATEDALREAWRVLASPGVLLVWEPRLPNPFNRNTTLITTRLVRRALPDARLEIRTTTLLPALARRLGARTGRLYPRLASVPLLRTHRLVAAHRSS